MSISKLQSILIGLVSGLTDFLPISGDAHRTILGTILGLSEVPSALRLFLHLGSLAALILACREDFRRMDKERRIAQIPRKRRKRQPVIQTLATVRMLETAAVSMAIVMLFRFKTEKYVSSFPFLAVTLLINGIILYVPTYFAKSNRDARNMIGFDGVLMGIAAGLGVIPGISRTGAVLSVAEMRGAGSRFGTNFTLYLCAPALLSECLLDFIGIFTGSATGFSGSSFLSYILGGVAAAVGSYLAIRALRFLSAKIGFTRFSFYCWGASLLCLVLFLTGS